MYEHAILVIATATHTNLVIISFCLPKHHCRIKWSEWKRNKDCGRGFAIDQHHTHRNPAHRVSTLHTEAKKKPIAGW
jgi:hypothetical protein